LGRFIDKAFKRGASVDSRIILAFDLHYTVKEGLSTELFKRALTIFNQLRETVAGIKIGLPTLLTLGEEAIYRLINEYDWGYFFIADLKIADVNHVNRIIVDHLSEIGFDAVIAHAIIGFEGGLGSVMSEARDKDMGVLALLAMTHPGADDVLNNNFNINLEISLKADVDGFILPANKTELISKVRNIAPKKLIASPGIGYQGSEPGSAVSAGADFEIIGRAIYMSGNPYKAAEKLRKILRWRR